MRIPLLILLCVGFVASADEKETKKADGSPGRVLVELFTSQG